MKTCPRCGVENKHQKAACWNCWAPLDGPAGAAAAPKPTSRVVSLAVPWTAVAVVALVLLAAAGTYFFFLKSEPADVAEEYLRAVRNGNEEKRDRLSSRDTSGQSVLPPQLMVAEYEVQRDGVIVSGKQAEVPASVQLTLNPELGLTQPVLADLAMKHLQKHPVRANMVLAKEGFNWRVDQQQTQTRFTQAVFRDLPPNLVGQVTSLLTGRIAPGPTVGGGLEKAAPGAAVKQATPAGKLRLGASRRKSSAPANAVGSKMRTESSGDALDEAPKGGFGRSVPSDLGD